MRWRYNYTMAVNGKNKGSSFERKIANMLSSRFEPHLGVKNGFRRNPDSGSFFGGSNQQRTESYNLDYAVFGDLICPRSFRFSVECKHYKSPPSFQSVVNHKVSQWDLWLEQAERDAQSSNRLMCLIVKYNNVDEIVFLHEELPACNHARYRDYRVHRLSDWLCMGDTYFFDGAILTETDVNGNARVSPGTITGARE